MTEPCAVETHEDLEAHPIEMIEVKLGYTPGHRARIGLIALASGFTCEEEMHAMLPADTLVLTTRVKNSDSIDLGNLAAMENDLVRAASTLLPEGHLDVVVYSCTSGTVAMGEQTVFDRIREVKPDVEITTPFTASVAALNRLGANKVVLITPYTKSVTEAMRHEIQNRGVCVKRTLAMGLGFDSQMCRVSPQTVREVAMQARTDDVDALFISCTALTTSPVIDAIEQAIGKPVVTSNQALTWHALRLAGYEDELPGLGQVFRLRLT